MLDSDQSSSLWIQFFKRELYYNFPTEDVAAVEDLSVFLCSRVRLITHASMLKLESFLTFLYDANLMQIAERVCEQFIEYVHAYQPDISNSIDFLERFAASTTLTPKIKMQLIEIVDEARKRE